MINTRIAAFGMLFCSVFFAQSATALDINAAQKITTIYAEMAGPGLKGKALPISVKYLDRGYYKWAFTVENSAKESEKRVLLIIRGDMETYTRIRYGDQAGNIFDLGEDLSTNPISQNEVEKTLNMDIGKEVFHINMLREYYGLPMVQLFGNNIYKPIRFKCLENANYFCMGYLAKFYGEKSGWKFFKRPDNLVRFFEISLKQLDTSPANYSKIAKLISYMKKIFSADISVIDLQGFVNSTTYDVVITDPFGVGNGNMNIPFINYINKVIMLSNYYRSVTDKRNALLPSFRSRL